MDKRPKGFGDFANILHELWADRELGEVLESIEDLERHPGFNRLLAVLDARDAMLVERLVVEKPEDVRVTDQAIGMLNGLRQSRRAIESIKYEVNQRRERLSEAAAEADARGATT